MTTRASLAQRPLLRAALVVVLCLAMVAMSTRAAEAYSPPIVGIPISVGSAAVGSVCVGLGLATAGGSLVACGLIAAGAAMTAAAGYYVGSRAWDEWGPGMVEGVDPDTDAWPEGTYVGEINEAESGEDWHLRRHSFAAVPIYEQSYGPNCPQTNDAWCYSITPLDSNSSTHRRCLTVINTSTQQTMNSNDCGNHSSNSMTKGEEFHIRARFSHDFTTDPDTWVPLTGYVQTSSGEPEHRNFFDMVVAPENVPVTITREIDCYDSGTDQTTTYSQTSAPYDPTTEPSPPMPAITCPPGDLLVGARSFTSTHQDLTEFEAPTEWTDPNDVYRDCLDREATSDPCLLALYYVSDSGQLVRCDFDPGLCVDWHTHPQKEQQFECLWGPHVMPLTDCEPFRKTFNPDTPGEIEPRDEEGPITGIPLPGSDPGTAPGITESIFRRALEWAFSPSPETVSQLQTQWQTLQGKPPFSWMTALTGGGAPGQPIPVPGVPSDAEQMLCWEATIDMTDEDVGEFAVIDTCGDHPVYVWLRDQRGLLANLVWGAFLFPLAWWMVKEYSPFAKG